MKRMLAALRGAISSRALPPLVFGFFLLLYIGIAFFTEEVLIFLIALTGRNLLLAAVLGLLPLNSLCRLAVEAGRCLKRRRALTGAASTPAPALYDETLDLEAPRGLAGLESRMEAAGYRTRKSGDRLAAWRGISLSPARMIFLAGTFCLFAGVLVSLTSRNVQRLALIEGEPFQAPSGAGGQVRSITLKHSAGPILLRELVMEVAEAGEGGGVERFGVYPPALFGGAFAYPRYLGIALDFRFSAPDLPGGYRQNTVLPLYPPGREASVPVPDSPYRITVSLAKPEDGSDPYMTGRMVFVFKLLKGADLLFTGTVPDGGEFSRDGFLLALPAAKRMVITDFVVDYGVLLIWSAALLFLLAALVWLPVRLFFPRREMLFRCEGDLVAAFSRAEGRSRPHAELFHEMLDFLAVNRSAGRPQA